MYPQQVYMSCLFISLDLILIYVLCKTRKFHKYPCSLSLITEYDLTVTLDMLKL